MPIDLYNISIGIVWPIFLTPCLLFRIGLMHTAAWDFHGDTTNLPQLGQDIGLGFTGLLHVSQLHHVASYIPRITLSCHTLPSQFTILAAVFFLCLEKLIPWVRSSFHSCEPSQHLCWLSHVFFLPMSYPLIIHSLWVRGNFFSIFFGSLSQHIHWYFSQFIGQIPIPLMANWSRWSMLKPLLFNRPKWASEIPKFIMLVIYN